jgi:DNA invertase Pin-like site-specific DNA recombinase
MIFGYARVSTKEQNLDLQIDALKKAGCKKIFQEKASGMKQDRPELEKLLEQLRTSDTLIVYSIDRLGRTVKQLIQLINDFKEQGVNFRSITEGAFDTTTPMGEAVFQIMAILKGLEISILRERTMKGLDAARARGRKGGRKLGSYNKEAAAYAVSLYQKQKPISDILKTVHISRATLYEYLKKEGVKYSGFKKSKKLK